MAVLIQPSFAKGVISPSLYGRIDLNAYFVALRTGRNIIVHPFGGFSNRPGSKYLGPVKDHTNPPILVDFQFKTTDQYVLEIGNTYMRFIRNDAAVLETATAVSISNITNASPAVVTATSHGFSDGDEVFIDSVVGMTEVNSRHFVVANSTANTFELTDQVDGTNIDSSGYAAYSSAGTVTKIYEITTPYAQADLLSLKYTQSADTMIITHPSYDTRKLTRTDHDAWTLTTVTFAPEIDDPTGLTLTVNSAGSETYRYQVTSIEKDTFKESLPGVNNTSATITGATQANPVVITATSHGFADGDEVEIAGISGMTEINDRRFIVANQTANTFELKGEDGTGHTAYSSGGTARRTFVVTALAAATPDNTISWTDDPNAERYSVYKEENGVYGYIGDAVGTSFTDDNITPDLTVTPPIGKNPFFGASNRPAAVSFFEQRAVYGGSLNNPDTSYFSRIGDFFNMSVSSPTRADDAITATLSSQEVNEIKHYVPLNDLLVFTSGGEWQISSGPDSNFSDDTIRQRPQSFWGASDIRPIVVGNEVLYMEESNNEVRSIGYSFQIDGYKGNKLNLLATHLLGTNNKTAVDWFYQHAPESRLHVILEDGCISTMTYEPDQEVIAWTEWDTEGSYERGVQLRHTSGSSSDNLYVVVKRTVGGNTVRYIEKFDSRTATDIRDMFFVDSGLTFDTPITVTGVTAADPVVVTAASHGLLDGDEVEFSDITWVSNFDSNLNETQPSQLNNIRFLVKNATTNTFELTDLDGVDIDGSAYNAYVSGGFVRKAVSTVSGLWHLEGETVSILADGSVEDRQAVSNGTLTFTTKVARAQIGLRFISDAETLDIEGGQGTMQGKLKKVGQVTVRVKDTRGLSIGPDRDNLIPIKQRKFEAWSDPTELLTGDFYVSIPPHWNTNGRIFMRQSDPLPLTVLAVIPDIEQGSDRIE